MRTGKNIGIIIAVIALLLQLCACENNDSPDSSAATADTSPADLEETLGRLGVDTTQTPRVDSDGTEYPESYAPLGSVISVRKFPDASEPDGTRFVVGRGEELLLVGYRPDSQAGVISVVDDLSSGTETNGFTLADTLFQKSAAQAPWAIERSTGGNSASGPPVVQGTSRDATAGDFNGDGFRESAVVYYVEQPNGSGEIRLLVSDSMSPEPSEFDIALSISAEFFPINDLRVVSGDFDGDQKDELAVAIARAPDVALPDTPVGIFIIDDETSGFSTLGGLNLNVDTALTSPFITLVIEDAKLDFDIESELVLVINENVTTPSFPGSFSSQYFILENQVDGLSVLSQGPVAAVIGDETVSAAVAGLATDDLDGDSLDEVIFGGLEEVVSGCNSSDTTANGLKHVMIAIGNHSNDFALVDASAAAIGIPNCDANKGFLLRYTHVNTLDFDGDDDVDIQLNTMIFDSFPGEDWSASLLGEITDSSVMLGDQEEGLWFDRSNSTMMVTDQTADAIDDIVSIFLDEQQPYLKVWRCDKNEDTGKCDVSLATRVALRPGDMNPFGSSNPDSISNVNPILVAVDVDNDDVTLYKYDQEHILDFTEPMVIVALAAPPCVENVGQALDECVTTWGSASSTTVERTLSLAIKGSVSFGSGTAGAGFIAKSKHTISVEAGFEKSEAYELTRSLAFTTGPTEDSVVFIAVPIDRYGYEVVSSTDPDELGAKFYVDLPRDLIMLIATREYYNANVQPGALQIDSAIFDHVAGDLSTYPTEDDKDFILATQKTKLQDSRLSSFDPVLSRFDPVEALGGLEVGPVSVGEGSGATELALEYVESSGGGNSLELAYEYEVETAAGILAGFSVGISGSRTITATHGDSTIYSGAIGSINKDFFAENRYSFGLFAYIQAEHGQEFEVLNYWVETN